MALNKLKESNKDTYKVFEDYCRDYAFADGYFDEDALEVLADRQLGNSWDVRTWHLEAHMLALNVKGQGAGNWDSFNKDNRAGNVGLTPESYYDITTEDNTIFYRDWEEEFQNRFGIELEVGGRSGGWWGFKTDDVTNGYIIQPIEGKLQELYDTKADTLFNDVETPDEYEIQELAYDLMGDVDLSDYFEFTPEFVKACEEFENSVKSTSDYMETDDYNDQMFSFYDESKVNNGKRIKENLRFPAEHYAGEALKDLIGTYSRMEYEEMGEDDKYEACFDAAMNYVDGDSDNFDEEVQSIADILYAKMERGPFNEASAYYKYGALAGAVAMLAIAIGIKSCNVKVADNALDDLGSSDNYYKYNQDKKGKLLFDTDTHQKAMYAAIVENARDEGISIEESAKTIMSSLGKKLKQNYSSVNNFANLPSTIENVSVGKSSDGQRLVRVDFSWKQSHHSGSGENSHTYYTTEHGQVYIPESEANQYGIEDINDNGHHSVNIGGTSFEFDESKKRVSERVTSDVDDYGTSKSVDIGEKFDQFTDGHYIIRATSVPGKYCCGFKVSEITNDEEYRRLFNDCKAFAKSEGLVLATVTHGYTSNCDCYFETDEQRKENEERDMEAYFAKYGTARESKKPAQRRVREMDENLLAVNALCDNAIRNMEKMYNMSDGQSDILNDWENALFFSRETGGAYIKGRLIQWLGQEGLDGEELWYDVLSSCCKNDPKLKAIAKNWTVVESDPEAGVIRVKW